MIRDKHTTAIAGPTLPASARREYWRLDTLATAGAFATEHHQAEFAFAPYAETSDDTVVTDAASVFVEEVTMGMNALATPGS